MADGATSHRLADGISDADAWRAITALAFAAGGVDAVGLGGLGHFVSHMSGTTSNFSASVVSERIVVVALSVTVLAAFLLGAAVTGMLVVRDRWHEPRQAVPTLLWIEAGLILAASIVAFAFRPLASPSTIGLVAALLAAAMGCQNRTGVILAGGKARTTHVTGTLTDLGHHIGRLASRTATARASRADDVAASARMLALFLDFVVGGLVGCALLRLFGVAGVAMLALIPAVIGGSTQMRLRILETPP